MFVIFATTKAHNKRTMFCASFLSYNLSCEFNLPGPGLLEGIMELLLVPCGPGVLAPADQRCLFLTLPAPLTHSELLLAEGGQAGLEIL